jgi:hypothetical protein
LKLISNETIRDTLHTCFTIVRYGLIVTHTLFLRRYINIFTEIFRRCDHVMQVARFIPVAFLILRLGMVGQRVGAIMMTF